MLGFGGFFRLGRLLRIVKAGSCLGLLTYFGESFLGLGLLFGYANGDLERIYQFEILCCLRRGFKKINLRYLNRVSLFTFISPRDSKIFYISVPAVFVCSVTGHIKHQGLPCARRAAHLTGRAIFRGIGQGIGIEGHSAFIEQNDLHIRTARSRLTFNVENKATKIIGARCLVFVAVNHKFTVQPIYGGVAFILGQGKLYAVVFLNVAYFGLSVTFKIRIVSARKSAHDINGGVHSHHFALDVFKGDIVALTGCK